MSIVTARRPGEVYVDLYPRNHFSTNTMKTKNQVLRLLSYVFHLL